MTEKSADNINGFLVYNPSSGLHFLRVYNEDKSEFTDYKLAAEDIEISIMPGNLSLYDDPPRLDWASTVLKDLKSF